MVRSFGVSDAGAVRRTNEDCFLADDDLCLFVVADGMGGHAAGEVASKLAVESIENFVRRSTGCEDFSWPFGIEPTLTFGGNRLRTAISLANRRVFRAAEGHDDYTGMGATVACGLVNEGRLIIGHVGDSRAYLLSNGSIAPLTVDDTWANTLAAGQGVDPATLKSHPMRHVLTNVLGAREHAEIHISEQPLADGQTLLLCTDGVHGVIDDETLRSLTMRDGSLQEIVGGLIDAARARGSRDNMTAVVVQFFEDGRRPDA